MKKPYILTAAVCLLLCALTACGGIRAEVTLPEPPEEDAPPQVQTVTPEIPEAPEVSAPSLPQEFPAEEPSIPEEVEGEGPAVPPASPASVYNNALEEIAGELHEADGAAVYDNDVIIIPASHSQGRAGDSFWPYTVYQYDPAADRYQKTAWVDAWDRQVADGADWAGIPFPADVDADGDGVVYYILPDGSYAPQGEPVDGPAYETWRTSLLEGAAQLDIP